MTMNPAKVPPTVRLLALLARMVRAAFPCALSLGLLKKWTLEEVAERNACAAAALAIDDLIEHGTVLARLEKLMETSLANETPATRRQFRAAFAELKAALADEHARTEALAAELRVQLPLSLSH